jgi:hypothetical protein
MGFVKTNRIFVYGDFFVGKRAGLTPIMQPFALEILREFSSTEFVGKIYVRVNDSWVPATQTLLFNYHWYTLYQKEPSHVAAKKLYFSMEGSGIWQVENLRDESDESGPYVAVALKFGGTKEYSLADLRGR